MVKDERPLIIITARIGSSRLPGKVLKTFWKDYSLLEFLIKRLQSHEATSRIIVATVDSPENNIVAQKSVECGVKVVRGPEDDVVKRMGLCEISDTVEYISRVTADNPFTDPELFVLQWNEMKRLKADYSYCKLSPVGTASDIWTYNCFESTLKNASTKYEKEHANAWVWNHPELNQILWFVPPDEYISEKMNLSIDKEEDFRKVQDLAKMIDDPITSSVAKIKKLVE